MRTRTRNRMRFQIEKIFHTNRNHNSKNASLHPSEANRFRVRFHSVCRYFKSKPAGRPVRPVTVPVNPPTSVLIVFGCSAPW